MIPALLVWLSLQAGPADADYERGMALAREQRWAEAREAFESGRRKAPLDRRFPLELAGIAFKQKNYAAAKAGLRAALKLDPRDTYANDFLATLYLLDGNAEAALKYWNRAGKPRIGEIHTEPEPRLDPVLLDRAFAFSPASVLTLDQYRTTQARLALLDAFPQWRFELVPVEAGEGFDVVLRSRERYGWLSMLQGLPFESIRPEFYNLRGSGANLTSLLRWDPQKRRAFAAFSAPLAGDPAWRYRVFFDGRDENWDTARTGLFKLRKIEAGGGIESVVNGRWSWMTGLSVSRRTFRDSPFSGGTGLAWRAGADHRVLDIPDRRLTADATGSWELGRIFARPFGLFSRTQAGLETRWFPQARGEDYETTGRLRAGKMLGRAPFDELFMLGLERDNDLLMRAHIGTAGGRKGSAPMGRDYAVFNWETDKLIHDAGFAAFKIGPFLDSGRIWDRAGGFGSAKWLWDTGVQSKVRLPGGITFVLSFGKDLRSGRNAFYARVE